MSTDDRAPVPAGLTDSEAAGVLREALAMYHELTALGYRFFDSPAEILALQILAMALGKVALGDDLDVDLMMTNLRGILDHMDRPGLRALREFLEVAKETKA